MIQQNGHSITKNSTQKYPERIPLTNINICNHQINTPIVQYLEPILDLQKDEHDYKPEAPSTDRRIFCGMNLA